VTKEAITAARHKEHVRRFNQKRGPWPSFGIP